VEKPVAEQKPEDARRLIANRYQLHEAIGTGAMGVVWKGQDQLLHREVALKELLLRNVPGAEHAPDAETRAMREARIAARLLHPNAIAVFDVVEDDGNPWLVMEYLPSTSLADLLVRRGQLPAHQVAAIGYQIAAALAAAHESGIVHRDVKPANVLIAEDGTAKITDFGISRAVGDVTVTASGIVAGTPAYLAPEVARGDDANSASDVFSLGSTLCHAVEGSPPFGFDDNAIALLYRVGRGEFTPPQQSGPVTPVLHRMLALDPQARPTMAECAAELAAIAEQGQGQAVGASDEVQATGPRRRGVVTAALAGAVVLLVLGGLLVAWLVSRDTGGTTPAADGGGLPASTSVSAGVPAGSSQAGPTDDPDPGTSASSPAPESRASSGSSASSSPSSPSPPVLPRPRQLENAVRDYYALLPGNLEQAYSLLTEGFKSSRSQTFADYESFWGRMSAVQVSDVTAGGGNTVAATVTYTEEGGGTQSERHVYSLVEQDGRWLIDSQAAA
jgi:serine/threonine protein kinase